MTLLILSGVLAFILGFSAHRTGMCTVAAVAEVITSRTGMTFLSFLKVMLWVVLVTSAVAVFMPELNRSYVAPAVSVSVIVGGFVFGAGAGINGSCSFATLSKIAQGNLHFALTLPAFVAGAFTCAALPIEHIAVVIDVGGAISYANVPLGLLVALAVLACIELVAMLRRTLFSGGASGGASGMKDAITGKRYRLSTGAALIGVTSAFLYLVHGRWAYSSRLMDYLREDPVAGGVSGATAVYLLSALLVGAGVSAVSNREFKVSFAGDQWRKNVMGGFLMGFGAVLIPGGNAKLLLQDLPHLSLHAILAYVAMVVGITLVLLVRRRAFGLIDHVSCAGDECQITKAGSKPG